MLVWEFGIGAPNNPLIDIFLCSHLISARYFINIVGRNSVSVTHLVIVKELNECLCVSPSIRTSIQGQIIPSQLL